MQLPKEYRSLPRSSGQPGRGLLVRGYHILLSIIVKVQVLLFSSALGTPSFPLIAQGGTLLSPNSLLFL